LQLLKGLSIYGSRSKEILGYNPKTTLKTIHEIVLAHNAKFEKIYSDFFMNWQNTILISSMKNS
jgi:hypothetical protein